MPKYIDSEAALRDWPLCDEPGDAYQFIKNFPAADVRPERYARKTKFFNEPWTGSKFTTCTACYGKVGPHDKFCKHCGAKFEE